MEKKDTFLKIIVILAFFIMILVNVISFYKPFGLRSIAEVSAINPTLLTPADFSFSIWGIIYLLLFAFVIYQLGILGRNRLKNEKEILHQARITLILTSFMNAAWVAAWIYDYMALSVILILSILIVLRIFTNQLRREYLQGREKLLVRMPFSIYFGWITLAAALNIVILMISVQWNLFGLGKSLRIVIAMIVITFAGACWMLRNHDIIYGFTLIWGYIGILVKHISPDGWKGEYPAAIISTIVGIAVIMGGICYLLVLRKKRIL
jgi:hypothetical protein